jgi:hypothetical protein
MNMKNLWSRLGEAWCKLAHPAPMWPVKGYYTCPACLRSYRVPWEHEQRETSRPAPASMPAEPRPVLVHSSVTKIRRPAAA